MMAKKAATKSIKKSTRKAGQRDLVRAKNASFFAKRDAHGQLAEMDKVGRSLRADRARKAKRSVKSGLVIRAISPHGLENEQRRRADVRRLVTRGSSIS
jgi:hypothetical protein